MSVTENELIIADDDLIISDGETSSGLLIQNGNYVTVEAGGTLTDSLLTDVNTMVLVEEGGIVKDVSATDNSWLYVCGSGTNLTAEEAAQVTIFVGGTWDKGLVRNNAVGNVFSSAFITGVTVTNARLEITGGTAKNTIVQEDGDFAVLTVKTESEDIFTGVAQFTTITGGTMRLENGGTAEDTTVNAGEFRINSGSADRTTVLDGAMNVLDGNMILNTTVSGGKVVLQNAEANTVVVHGGEMAVLSSSTVQNATLSGGTLNVSSGGTASDTIMKGGDLTVFSGGTATGIIEDGGYVEVEEGASATFVPHSFSELVLSTEKGVYNTTLHSGTTANSTTIMMGRFIVCSSGTANDTVNSGGSMWVSSGGIVNNTTIYAGGSLYLCTGGKMTGQMTFENGAAILVEEGAIVDFDLTGTTAGAPALLNDFWIVDGTPDFTLTVDGTQEFGDYILAGNAAEFDSTITVVNTVGEALGVLTLGETRRIADTAYTLNLSEDVLYVSLADGTGIPIISSGTVIENEEQIISSGVIYQTTIVSSGGRIQISRGGTANDPTVYDGGGIDVYSGGLINGAVISSGYLAIHSSGTANFTTIVDGGSMYISNGGYASDTVCSSGSVSVYDGGIADGVDVKSRGKLHISSGGTLTGQMTFENGAIVSAHPGAIIDFDLTGTTAGAPALLNDLSIVRGTPAYTLTVDGMQETGSYALAENATGFDKTITVRNPAGEELGTISAGGSLTTANAQYTLRLFQGVLSVSVAEISSASVVSSGLVLLDEGRIVSDGEIYEDTTIFSGGWLYVSSGGVADDVYVDFQGEMIVSSGGKATGNIHLEDQMGISFEEGSILEFDLLDTPPGAPAIVNDLSRIEGTPDYTLVVNTDQANGVYFLARGAEGFDKTITVTNKIGEGLDTLSVGGTLTLSGIDFTLVLSDGTLCLSVTTDSDAPVTYSGLVLTNEDRIVYPGEIYEWITVNNGSWLYVTSGGFVTTTTVHSGGGIHISSGGTVDNSVISGYLAVSSGGILNDATVISGGLIDIFSSGTANDTIVSSGGSVYVSSGGTANKTTVNANGELTVFTSGTANNTLINEGGSMYVSSEGTADKTFVSSGGLMRVTSGGTATLIEASSGALLDFPVAPDTYIGGTYDNAAFEIKDGIAKLCPVNSGCILRVSSGGVASGIFIYNGGDLQVSSGGVASRTQVSGGTVDVESGGTANSTTMNNGKIFVSSGGSATATTINGGNLQVSSDGSVNSTTVNAGGDLSISSGATADSTTVNSGGMLQVSSGGTATNIVASTGARMRLVVASDTYIQGEYNGKSFEMKDAYISGYEVYFSAGCLDVSSGGTANNTIVNNWGYVYVNSSGTANRTTLNTASMFVYSGGIANDTIVYNANLYISSGGTANNTTVDYNGGFFFVYTGATANRTTLNKGSMFVSSGGQVSDITINNGTLFISSGKLTGKITVEDGAIISMTRTVLDFDISPLAPEEGALVNNLSKFRTGAFTLTVSDTQWNGVYTLAEGAADFDNLITLKSLSGETLGLIAVDETVTVNGVEYTLTLTDDVLSVTVTGGEDLPVIPVYADITDMTNQVVTVAAEFGADSEIQEYSFDNETWLAYTEPVSFEENGSVHFIGRRQDGTVTEAANYEVTNIDKVPPEAPAATADISAPTNTDVFVSAEFSDDTAFGEYSLDGENWNDYSGAVKFEANGIVYFRATDAVGNVSDVTPFEVTNIDKTAPEAPTAAADVTTPTNQAVSVSATFSEDSVKQEYSLDGENWNEYSGAVSLEANGTVYFRGTDAVGNVSEIANYEVTNIDTTAPEKPAFTADITTPTNTDVTVTAEFSADSVRKEYSLDGTNWSDYIEAITFTENGTVSFRGTDEAGNVSEVASYEVTNIDRAKPVITLAADTTTPLQASTLTATVDDGSDIYYSTDGTNWTKYEGEIAVTANATYDFRATDAAGNTGTCQITFANIDTTAPVITLTGDNETPLQASTLTATVDDGSKMFYCIGGSEVWTEYTGTLEVKANAVYDFKATDAAGNTGTCQITFVNIDTTAPTVSDVKADITAPTNQNVIVTAAFADNVAVASSLYRIGDTGEWTAYVDGVTVTQNTTVQFKAVDTADNASEIVSFTVSNIDKAKPVITLIGDNQTPVRQTMLTALVDDGSEIYYSTDQNTWTKFEGQFVVSANETYYFRATDAAGNTGTEQITFANIDSTAPAKPVISADKTAATNQAVTVTAVFSDDSVVRKYSLDGQTWQDYTAPLVFDQNCIVAFLCADAAGNEAYATYSVTNIDTTLPAKPVAFADVTRATNDKVNVTAVFSDDSVKKEFSLDGENWTDYNEPITFTENGTVSFRGTDAAGNVSYASYAVENIDKSAPAAPTASADVQTITNGDVLVSAVFSDDSITKEYSLDGKKWIAYTEPVKFTENGSVSFRGTDEAGNVSEIASYTVSNIDKVAPDAPVAAADITTATNGDVFVSAAFSADSIAKEYSLDGKTWNAYTAAIKFTENGTAFFRGIDEVGNVSEVSSFEVTNIDKIAPDAPAAIASITDPTRQSVSVTGVFSEDCTVREYSYDGKEWLTYTAPIMFTENGTVSFRGTDAAGNTSHVTEFMVSNIISAPLEMPIVSADITSPTNGVVKVSATFSEIAAVKQYSLDGQTWLDYDGPLVFSENGFAVFLCVDAAGVCAYAAYAVTNIDKVAPEQPGAYATATAPTNRDVTVKAMFSNDTSIKEYSLDGTLWLTYTDGIVFEENGIVYFRGADAAGNLSGITKYEVTNIDKIAPKKPVASADITKMTNTDVLVSAAFSEDSVQQDYSLDGETWISYDEAVVFSKNGSVSFRSFDEAGNVSEIALYSVVNIDLDAPAAPVASADVTTATNGNVTVTAVFSEDSVTKEYSLDSQTWQAYDEGGVIIIINGSVLFRGTDEAGNVSEVTSFEVSNIDKEAPIAPTASADVTTVTNGNVTVTAVFSEDSVTKEYSLDSQTWQAYTAAIAFSANGTVFFRGTDAAGNVSEVATYEVANIVIPDNKPDNGKNDYLYDKKLGWNDANISVTNAITGNGEICLDELCSINFNDWHNMFGNDGTKKDTGDVAKIDVETAAKLTFTIDSTAAGTFYVYEDGFDKKGNRKQIQVGKIAVKVGQTATLKDVCLTADGNYYVAMVAKNVNKAGAEGLYNVSVSSSMFFVDADNGGNDTAPKGQVISVGRGTTSLVLDSSEMIGSTTFANFIGFGDSIDYAKLDLASSAYLSFNVKADGVAKFIIWKQDAKGKLSKVSTTTLTAKNGFTATTKAQFLDTSKYTYYVSMESTTATKGGSAYYNVELGGNALFFDSADGGLNNVLYDKKAKAFKDDANFVTTEIFSGSQGIQLDDNAIGNADYSNFVGYGDAVDYARIELTSGGSLSFDLKATGDATFAVYRKTEKKGKLTLETIQTTKLTLAKGTNAVEKTTDLLAGLEAGEYYISMTAKNTKANDKGSVFYNVTANAVLSGSVSSALSMPETELASSGLFGTQDALSFDQYDADVLTDASVSHLAELNEKAAWLNISNLA